MKLSMKSPLSMKSTLLALTLLWTLCGHAAELQITLPQPQWLLPPVSMPLTQREAGLEPREQGIALRLGPLLMEGDYEAAQVLIEEELDAALENPYSAFSAGLNFVAGQIYLSTGADQKAETALQMALIQLPDFVRARQALGLLYLRQERYEEAREHITRAVSLGGSNAALFGYLGYLNQQTGHPWGAVGAYQQALMLEHANLQWQQGLLYALMGARQFESAQALIDELLAQYASDAGLWLYRANIAVNLQRPETALASLEMAIRLGDTSPGNLQACAQLHLQHGSMPRAIELLQASVAAGLDYDYIDLTLAYLIPQGEYDYARELLATARAGWSALSTADQSRVLNREASIALQEERTDAALTALQEAIELDPGNAEALLQLAGLQARERRYIQAELLYDRASAYPEVRERALLGLAQLALDQFAYAEALTLLREVQQLNPDRFDLRENVRILENLVANRPAAP
jgi:tetratricopeptide (TPR) repeat protein